MNGAFSVGIIHLSPLMAHFRWVLLIFKFTDVETEAKNAHIVCE